MATPEQNDLAESELERLIEVGKKQGLNSFDWEGILLRRLDILHNQAEIEYHLRGGGAT